MKMNGLNHIVTISHMSIAFKSTKYLDCTEMANIKSGLKLLFGTVFSIALQDQLLLVNPLYSLLSGPLTDSIGIYQ